MSSKSLPVVISFAAPAKIQILRERFVNTQCHSDSCIHHYSTSALRYKTYNLLFQLEFVRKRYHKDIMSSPVLMLNFCPDLLHEPLELHKGTRELLFLIDRSGSMSGTNIQRVKVQQDVSVKNTQTFFLSLGTNINLSLSFLPFLVSTGSYGGGLEESTFLHNAQHCGLWYHHQAPVHLQQAVH